MKRRDSQLVRFTIGGLSAVLASVAFSVSCGKNTSGSTVDSTTRLPLSPEEYATAKTLRIAAAKDAIFAFSKLATERRMEDELSIPKSRLRMATLISDLQQLAPSMTFAKKLEMTVGVWQEVWSDEQNPLPPGFKILRPQVFQVVRPDGVGFNIGVRSAPFGIGTAFIKLEASADLEKERTNVVFLKTYSKPGDLTSEKSLAELVQGILDESRPDVTVLPDSPFPRGPVGAKGTLETVYVDDDIRIVRGPNVYNNVVDTFVLKRVKE
jgi:hypothetical protein